MLTAFITHSTCLKHNMGSFHPESPERLPTIQDRLIAAGLFDYFMHYDAPKASREQLLRAHDAGYVDSIVASVPETGIVHIDADTAMNPHTLEAALHAAGGAILATDLVMSGQTNTAFSACRPPGHHAEHNKSMGFCFFNNVAVGIHHALETYGLERVAVIDFDVHHGNGTEDIFRHEPRVMMASIFQHPFYPYSGAEGRSERMVNIPMSAGQGSEAFREVVTKEWLPALHLFKPQLVYISAGFDAHWEDDMGSLRLVEDDYAWVTHELKAVAEAHAQGRIISVLEGGYELKALARSVSAHLKVLADL